MSTTTIHTLQRRRVTRYTTRSQSPWRADARHTHIVLFRNLNLIQRATWLHRKLCRAILFLSSSYLFEGEADMRNAMYDVGGYPRFSQITSLKQDATLPDVSQQTIDVQESVSVLQHLEDRATSCTFPLMISRLQRQKICILTYSRACCLVPIFLLSSSYLVLILFLPLYVMTFLYTYSFISTGAHSGASFLTHNSTKRRVNEESC